MTMTTLQAAVVSNLSKRQLNSARALQKKLDQRVGVFGSTITVSPAQHAAVKAAWEIAKKSGQPIPDAAREAARLLGLE